MRDLYVVEDFTADKDLVIITAPKLGQAVEEAILWLAHGGIKLDEPEQLKLFISGSLHIPDKNLIIALYESKHNSQILN